MKYYLFKRNKTLKIVSVLTATILICLSLSPIAFAEQDKLRKVTRKSLKAKVERVATDLFMKKVDPKLKKQVEEDGEKVVEVAVFVKKDTELKDILTDVVKRKISLKGFTLVSGKMKLKNIPKLASNPKVVAIHRPFPHEIPVPPDPDVLRVPKDEEQIKAKIKEVLSKIDKNAGTWQNQKGAKKIEVPVLFIDLLRL